LWLLPVALSATPLARAVTTSTSAPQSDPVEMRGARASFSATPLLTSTLRYKLHPALTKQLLSDPEAQLPVLVMMRAQPDLQQQSIMAAASPDMRRAVLVRELQATATDSQDGVLTQLTAAQQAGRASQIRALWIVNAVAAQADGATVVDIAARADVAFVTSDEYRQWIDPQPFFDRSTSINAPQAVEWNIARVRADQVWAALAVTGTGVVVANLDTGVDWQHPALRTNYRGYNSKELPNHLYSWFDATSGQAQYPYDGFGHGTHTMGTLAGQGGIGVAPGARWIAARVFDSQGFAFNSWIHAGFQWMLAPGGDPTQAPDVLSNSWGNDNGYSTEFQADVRLLNAAGIDTFFSNGNAGPTAYTVGSPASLPEAFSVGAVDDADWIASFSSRGPSPFGPLKPDVSAPGVSVVSSVPGGGYRKYNGTSMAAPHAAGIAALMRSAAPDLSITTTRYALTSTAFRPTTDTYPNNLYGWGRVDAFNAVLAVTRTGTITGVVQRRDTFGPLPGATVRAQSDQGAQAAAQTDETGHYQLHVAAGVYTLTAEAFGYAAQSLPDVPIVAHATGRYDFSLTPLATGRLIGVVTDLTGTKPLTALINVIGTPVTITAHGAYSLALPAGTYVLRAQAAQHRVMTATVIITVGATTTRNLALPDAPTILLVDSGRWYNGSVIGYYRQALDDLGYLYIEWSIRDLYFDIPTTSTLRLYDVVIWSSPFDSPAFINAGSIVGDYLEAGGRLFLSGQDVGFFDGYWYWHPYYVQLLMSQLKADDGPTRRLTGAHIFAGQVVSIAGAGGADNQLYPDVIESNAPLFTEAAFEYLPNEMGGQTIGLCRPYRAVNLSYGFEAITDRAARAEVLSRSFDFFAEPPVQDSFVFDRAPDQLIAPAGSLVTGTLDLYNLDETAPFTFTVEARSAWPASVTPPSFQLSSCGQRSLTVTVQIPTGTPFGTTQPVTLTVQPAGGTAISITLIAKAPGSVLLVKDDRWYDVDAPYRSALDANRVSYDVWRVPASWAGPEPSTPSADRLSWYPQVMWFTGYDWYQSITENDERDLQQYLARGGRVLISSQDYAAGYQPSAFMRDVLGALAAADSPNTSSASGIHGGLFDGLSLAPLSLPYPNYSAVLAPQPGVDVVWVGDRGQPIALAHDMGISKTLFMAFGFEGLPATLQPEAMNRNVGYLSRLGRSSVKFDRETAAPGEIVTATIIVVNDEAGVIERAAFTLTLPASATVVSGDASDWSGALAPGQRITRTLRLKLEEDLANDTALTLPVEFRDEDQVLHFTQTARLKVAAPHLMLHLASAPPAAHSQQVVTWLLTARNAGLALAPAVMITTTPFEGGIIFSTISATTGIAQLVNGRVSWQGSLAEQAVVTISYQAKLPAVLSAAVKYASAAAALGNEIWYADTWLPVEPYRLFLPVIRK
jgi:hypothetical protein